MALKLNGLRQKQVDKVFRPKIKRGHPFYVVAMIKEYFGGSFRNYIRTCQAQHYASTFDRLSFTLKRLSILFKSLSSAHSDFQTNQKPIFTPNKHRLLRLCLSRLKLSALQSRSKRLNTVKALCFFLTRYQSTSLSRWQSRYL